jgi:hypothetical protein
MWAALTSIYASAIILIGAFLFTAVDQFEPNRRLAVIFKCAIIAAAGAAIANQSLSPTGSFGSTRSAMPSRSKQHSRRQEK